MEKYIDTLSIDTVPVLTLSLRENLSDLYHQRSPRRDVTYVKAQRMQGADEVLDMEGLDANLKAMFSEVAEKLGISEEELMKYHELPECTEKFKSQEKLYSFGIKLYEKLGLEMRIRK